MHENVKGISAAMRSNIVFVVLLMLSFTILHDSFITVIEKSDHTQIVHYMNDNSSSSDCADVNEIHNMFHYVAIMATYDTTPFQSESNENIPHRLYNYSSPFKETSLKPPIV